MGVWRSYAIGGNMVIISGSVEELCHWWKYGDY